MSKSKHNYSQYSNNKNANKRVEVVAEPIVDVEHEIVTVVEALVEPVVATEPIIKNTIEPVVEAPVEKKPEPALVTGVVTGCMKLNVREKPTTSADVVCVLDSKSEVKIDMKKSNAEWLRIGTAAGVDGYCMRKFVNINV